VKNNNIKEDKIENIMTITLSLILGLVVMKYLSKWGIVDKIHDKIFKQ
jgi:hypothetical protein